MSVVGVHDCACRVWALIRDLYCKTGYALRDWHSCGKIPSLEDWVFGWWTRASFGNGVGILNAFDLAGALLAVGPSSVAESDFNGTTWVGRFNIDELWADTISQ